MRKASVLQAELESFARRARGLTAENLDTFPGVLEALFEEDVLLDPDERRRLAILVREAILQAVGDCRLAKERQAGDALFAIDEDLHGMPVGRCLPEVHLTPRTYYDARRKVIARVVHLLRKEFATPELSVSGLVLSAEARRASRQLYRYAQPALILLDACEQCAYVAARIRQNISVARARNWDREDVPYGWLAKYTEDGSGSLRMVPTARTCEIDYGLWSLSHFYRYLRVLLRDRTGRDLLRENLPMSNWQAIQLRPAFEPDELDHMLDVLLESPMDIPEVYIETLCQDREGQDIHKKWLDLLTGQPFFGWGEEGVVLKREELIGHLLMLCIALQHVFPTETLSDPSGDFREAVSSLLRDACEQMGVPMDAHEDWEKYGSLIDTAMEDGPSRYERNEDNEERRCLGLREASELAIWTGLPPVMRVGLDFTSVFPECFGCSAADFEPPCETDE